MVAGLYRWRGGSCRGGATARQQSPPAPTCSQPCLQPAQEIQPAPSRSLQRAQELQPAQQVQPAATRDHLLLVLSSLQRAQEIQLADTRPLLLLVGASNVHKRPPVGASNVQQEEKQAQSDTGEPRLIQPRSPLNEPKSSGESSPIDDLSESSFLLNFELKRIFIYILP